MSCDRVCCMCGEAWSSRWLMTQLTNDQHACMFMFSQWWTFWTYLATVNLFSLYLMNFMFHTTLDAVGNILRVHYKSMKCDVSLSQGSVSTIFPWGERVFHVCVKMFFLPTAVQKYNKSSAVAEIGDRGHNRHGPKRGGCAPFAERCMGTHLIQCGLRRCLLPCQVASSSIQPFGHNSVGCHSPHRNISTCYYLVLEMHTVTVRSDDARYLLN